MKRVAGQPGKSRLFQLTKPLKPAAANMREKERKEGQAMQSLSRKNLALVSNPEYVTLEAIPSKSQRKTLDVIPHEKSKLTTKNVKHEKMIPAILIAALRMEMNP